MIKFIKYTNEWYESLSEVKSSVFYLSLVFIPYIALMILLNKPYNTISIIWPVLVAIWRLSYKIIK
jgi:hypothetical protein